MNTPIHDFVKAYCDLHPVRFHMPGHKGRGPLGCEDLDLTEIPGADSLYEASGIIAESEANASRLFGCPTFYSTEGSSHCIRAMLLLASQACHSAQREAFALPDARSETGSAARRCGSFDFAPLRSERQNAARLRVLAARNCHKAFLSAAALLDLDVAWLSGLEGSYLSAQPTPETLDAALAATGASAVYLTFPDYLGVLPELRPLAEVCHAHHALLLVDNAHGAYLRFLSPSRHPIDLGADLCCDSAHKTLPVLTGGAYLHVSHTLAGTAIGCPPEADVSDPGSALRSGAQCAPHDALELFGSSSPSYLILQSLDLANPYLERLPERLAAFLPRAEALKARLTAAGWRLIGNEPLKLTLDLRPPVETGIACPPSGTDLASMLEQTDIFCEFADVDYLVFMLSPENTARELERLEAALIDIISQTDDGRRTGNACPCTIPKASVPSERETAAPGAPGKPPKAVCSIREAMLAPAVTIPAAESEGRILARPGVSCPPAVPILMPGERIDAAARDAFARFGIETVQVLQHVFD